MKLYAEIVFPLPINQKFLYEVPDVWTDKAKVGSRVLASFHNRTLTGFILRLTKNSPLPAFDIKEINEVLDEKPVFSASILLFTQKLSEYYYSSLGELLQAALPAGYVFKSKQDVYVTEKGKKALEEKELSIDERKLLNLYLKRPYSEPYIKRNTGLKNISYLLNRLEKKDFIRIEKTIRKTSHKPPILSAIIPRQLEMDFSFDAELFQASKKISSFIGSKKFSPFYLFGSSRKREPIYFDLIKKNMALKKSTLFLVPEIAFTEAFTNKMRRRFGERVAIIHSRMTQKQRGAEWKRIKEGDTNIVVGPRSALFAPLEDLALIIIDEEQDDSYYQKENPTYDAKHGAWIRAQQESAVIIYGSSTPSVERYFHAQHQKYLVSLSNEKPLYRTRIVECRPNTWSIDSRIGQRILENMKLNNQALIFFNRRGYAPFIICSRCSNIPRCARCDIGLTYHKDGQKMICHYCGFSIPKPNRCPKCGAKIILGKSVGIEAIEEELQSLLPQAKISAFNMDVARNKKEQTQKIEQFSAGQIDILLGTQLLMHQRDLPPVSLVIALFPETSLSLSDFGASQRTFQSLSQMTSFLEQEPQSEFLIQTSLSPHFSIQCASRSDFSSFYNQEIKNRNMMRYPPFASMVEILFYNENLRVLAKNSRKFLSLIEGLSDHVEVLGPAFAPVSRVRGMNRVQVILKSKQKDELDEILNRSLPQIKIRKSVYVYDSFD
ncbi:primosomal protein N' [Acidobacteriota bacterium]